MSNELSLICTNHRPFIESGTVGVLAHDIDKIRTILGLRDTWLELDKKVGLDEFEFPDHGWRTAVFFIRAHPSCTIEIRDENGKHLQGTWRPDKAEEDGPVFGGVLTSNVHHVRTADGRVYNLEDVELILNPSSTQVRQA